MTISHKSVTVRLMIIVLLGLSCVVAGISLFFAWPSIFTAIVYTQLKVVPDSETFRIWRDTPVPQHMNFYFFNWTNYQHLDTKKPVLQELGPYRFIVKEEKTNIVHNENGTITFNVKRFWYFDQANSNGSLDDEVFTLNTVAKTAASSIKNWSSILRRSLSITMGTYGTKVYINQKVGELLFDGYSDPLLETASKLPAFAGLNVPFDKFGWFYKRNGSIEFDGLFNMDTGERDPKELGVLRRWNYKSSTEFYEGGCGMVNGSAGELFPPEVDPSRGIEMFSPDLCRSLKLSNSKQDVNIHGLHGYKFVGDEMTFDNGTLNPANSCFCDGDCSPSGVLNVTTCRFGAPGFVSFPHFHLADPIYREQVQGMLPKADRHTLYIALEPTFGVPLDVAARFQINILLTPDDTVSLFDEVPTIYFPMIWFEQRATISPELAAQVRLALSVLGWNVYIGCSFLALGAALLACSVYMFSLSQASVTLAEEKLEMNIDSLQKAYVISPSGNAKEAETLLRK